MPQQLYGWCRLLPGKLQVNRMKELIDRLQVEAGLTDFAKEKFPLFSGAIEKVFTKYSPKEDEDFLH